MAEVQGVVVMNDFVRPDRVGRPGEGDRSAVWLFDAIKRQIRAASQLGVRLLAARDCPELRAWVEAQRAPEQADEYWAASYENLPGNAALDSILSRHLAAHFVVGCEMPPYLLRLLATYQVPHLDIRIHPVRFLDDLLFAARASEPATQAALQQIAVSEDIVLSAAGLVEAMCRYTANCTLPPETLLVIGQRTMDSSQIVGGRFFDALPCVHNVRSICACYGGVVLKPHPYGGQHSLLAAAASAPNVRAVTADNVYRLLAQPEIAGVLTVNSSTAYEAPYFGKRVHTLAPLPVRIAWRDTPIAPDMYVSLDDWLVSVDFWRLVLQPHARVSRMNGAHLPAKPNRLRIAHDSFWNFQEIDTDRIPRGAAAGRGG